MEIEDLVDLILERVNSEPKHADRRVDERILYHDLYSLIEDYTKVIISDRVAELVEELEQAETRLNGWRAEHCHE